MSRLARSASSAGRKSATPYSVTTMSTSQRGVEATSTCATIVDRPRLVVERRAMTDNPPTERAAAAQVVCMASNAGHPPSIDHLDVDRTVEADLQGGIAAYEAFDTGQLREIVCLFERQQGELAGGGQAGHRLAAPGITSDRHAPKEAPPVEVGNRLTHQTGPYLHWLVYRSQDAIRDTSGPSCRVAPSGRIEATWRPTSRSTASGTRGPGTGASPGRRSMVAMIRPVINGLPRSGPSSSISTTRAPATAAAGRSPSDTAAKRQLTASPDAGDHRDIGGQGVLQESGHGRQPQRQVDQPPARDRRGQGVARHHGPTAEVRRRQPAPSFRSPAEQYLAGLSPDRPRHYLGRRSWAVRAVRAGDQHVISEVTDYVPASPYGAAPNNLRTPNPTSSDFSISPDADR